MNNNYTNFIFIRHAESEKNIRDITGGIGECLTKKGKQEASNFSKKLATKLDVSKSYSVISSNTLQTIDTGKQIAKCLNVELIVTDKISPAGLGIAGGLSGSQIAEKYPIISERLNAWRRQEIEAIDLQIPGMESPCEFWNRIIAYLMTFENKTNNIIVCTRSVMVLVANLVSGKRPFRGGGYKHVEINHCDSIAFELISEKSSFLDDDDIAVKLISSFTTVDLGDIKSE